MVTKRYMWVSILLLVALLASACAQATPAAAPSQAPAPAAPAAQSTEPTAAPAAAPAAKPTVLKVPLASDPKSLEPGLVLELVSAWVAENLHAGLVRYDKNENVTPYLADSWDIAPDGLTYTFHLNKSAKWQNDRPIVASDFVKGWERYLDPAVAAQAGADYLGNIVGASAVISGTSKSLTGAVAVDDKTLKISLEKVDPIFLLRLASSCTWVVPSEAVIEGKPQWKDKPVGAGPFKFVEWKANQSIVLEAWDGFFMGKPTVDRIEYYVVSDPSTSMAQYEAGELDFVSVAGADLKRAVSDAKLSKELNQWPAAQLAYFGLNPNKIDQFKDVRVRQAFAYALNHPEIVEKVQFNAVKPANGIVPIGISEHNANAKGYTYDPAKAKQLLAEAGFPDGKGFPGFQLTTSSTDSTVAEAAAAQWKQNLGVDVKVNIVERGEAVKGLWDHNTWQAFLWGWTADFPDAEIWTHQLLHSGLGSNFFNYNNPAFDKIVDEARSTVDDAKRIALWQQAEQIALDEAAMIPHSYRQYNFLVKPNVTGVYFRIDGPYWFKDVVVK